MYVSICIYIWGIYIYGVYIYGVYIYIGSIYVYVVCPFTLHLSLLTLLDLFVVNIATEKSRIAEHDPF